MKFAFLGPESTGKTTAIETLAKLLDARMVPEAAREYLREIGLEYTYYDIFEIAKIQVASEINAVDTYPDEIILCDTELITIEIWLEYMQYEVPSWISSYIHQSQYNLYLLFDIDIPWTPDPLRTHSLQREEIYQLFMRKLNYYHKDYAIIHGQGEERISNALNAIKERLGLG